MKIGLIGLGKMGGNMRDRLRAGGVEVVGYDRNPDVTDAASIDDLLAQLKSPEQPRVVWVMVPAGAITDSVITELRGKLDEGDLVIDGGNSRYTDDIAHAAALAERGIRFADIGVSGGVWGKENGYGLMAGGAAEDIEFLAPVIDALRPEGDRAESFVHAGKVGAGHYAKMVHNGIEYGLMQAYAEGFELLETQDVVENVPAILGAWRKGTVVRSWLLDLLVDALEEDPKLDGIKGYVDDSGEGRWTVIDAIENAVPVPVISASIFARFSSRQEDSLAMKAVSALRNQFGGHEVKKN